MSNIIALGGLSNSGKSSSLKYLDPKETFIISCTSKQLMVPGFRKKYIKVSNANGKLSGNWFISTNYGAIEKMLDVISSTREDIKVICIDDVNYLMSNEAMSNALVKG